MTPLRNKALKGAGATLLGYMTVQLLRLGSNIILSRMLAPEVFGLMALILLVLQGLEMLSDVGIKQAIIRHQDGASTEFLNTAWTLQIIRGLVLFAVALALTLPLSIFYEQEILKVMLPVAAIAVILKGFFSTHLIVKRRELEPGIELKIDIGSKVIAIAVMIVAALAMDSAWVLVLGSLVMTTCRLYAGHRIAGAQPNKMHWNSDIVGTIARTGIWIFFSTLLAYLCLRIDIFILGKLVELSTLGIYSIATMLAGIGVQIITRVESFVLLPALSSAYRESREKFISGIAEVRSIVLPCVVATLIFFASYIPGLVYYAYDDRYHDASWMAQLLLIATWFPLLQQMWGNALITLGDARPLALAKLIQLMVSTAGCLIGFEIAGTAGLIIGLAIGSISGYIIIVYKLSAHGIHCIKGDVAYTLLGLAIGICVSFLPKLAPTEIPWPIATAIVGTLAIALLLIPTLKKLNKVFEFRTPTSIS